MTTVTARMGYALLLGVWLAVMPATLYADNASELVAKGNRHYGDARYQDALGSYDAALAEKPDSPYLLYNRGTACYRLGDYEEAGKMFERSASLSLDRSLSALARYNCGNAMFRQAAQQEEADPAKAIEGYRACVLQYRQALAIDPDLRVAAENMEIARITMSPLMAELARKAAEEDGSKSNNSTDPQQKDPEPDRSGRRTGVDEEAQAILDEERRKKQDYRGDRGYPPDYKDW